MSDDGGLLALRDVQRFRDCLAIASLARDVPNMAVAAVRLRVALARVSSLVGAEHEFAISRILESVRPLLSTIPLDCCDASTLEMLHRWCATVGADLFDIKIAGALREASWKGLHVLRATLREADLIRSTFDDAVPEDCDLARANLARTSWWRAMVRDCRFTGAMLTDARPDEATFEGCDFSGADLGATGGPASIRGATFERCDLRVTSWHGRLLGSVKIIHCKLFGAHGVVTTEGVEIVDADMSPAADRCATSRGDRSVRSS